MLYTTYADIIRPQSRLSSLTYNATLVVGGSLLVALCAQLAIYLPFSPVPVTMQTFGVVLVGALLGSRRGALSMVAYLTEGAMGLPVFAGGGFGLAHLLGPTGGYLLGFVPAAFIVGWFAERGWDRRYWSTIAAMSLGTMALFICGLAWLVKFVGSDLVLQAGLFPFLPGSVVKIGLASILLPSGWKLLGLKKSDK